MKERLVVLAVLIAAAPARAEHTTVVLKRTLDHGAVVEVRKIDTDTA